MPIYGNTTGLPSSNERRIGRNYTGPNAILAGLDTERSRAAFKQRIKARESKALELREYAYKYIYRWTLQEKISLINSYGEIDRLQNPNNVDEVNNQLVETLLINLSEAELNQIVANVNAQEQELKQQMSLFTKNAKARGTMSMTGVTQSRGQRAQEFYSNINPDEIKSTQQTGVGGIDPGRDMQKEDLSFKRSMVAVKAAPSLNKELDKILKNMTLKEVLTSATKLKIEYTKNTKIETLKNEIKYVVSIYLAAITGSETSSVGPIPVDDSAITEVERLIGLTSSAWIVGKPILSPKALAAARKKAAQKRKEFEMRKKLVEEKKSESTTSADFLKTAGISGSKKDVTLLLDDPKNDKGFLKNFSYEECMSKAYELGLDLDPRKTTLGQLKVAIYAKVATQMKERKKLEQQLAKSRAKDKKNKSGIKSSATIELENLLSAHDNTIEKIQTKPTDLPDEYSTSPGASGASGIPLVTFEEGKIKTRNITSAVPVVVVGEENALNLFNQGKAEVEEMKDSSEENTFNSTIQKNLDKVNDIFESIDKSVSKFSKQETKRTAKKEKELNKNKEKIIESLDKPLDKKLTSLQKELHKAKPRTFLHTPTEGEIDVYKDKAEEIKSNINLVQQGYNKTINIIKKSDSKDEAMSAASTFMENIIRTDKINIDALNDNAPNMLIQGSTPSMTEIEPDKTLSLSEDKNIDKLNDIEQIKVEHLDNETDNNVLDQTPDKTPDSKETPKTHKKRYTMSLDKYIERAKSKGGTEEDGYNKYIKATGKQIGNVLSEMTERNPILGSMSKEEAEADQSSENWGKQIKSKKGSGDHIYYNTAAKKMLKNKAIKRENITPVFLVNGFTEYLNTITEEGFDNLIGMTGSIYQYLSTTLPILFQGLQEAGTSVNMATAGTAIATVLDIIQQVANAAMTAMDDIGGEGKVYKYATGGSGKRKTKTTVRPSTNKSTMNSIKKTDNVVSPIATAASMTNILEPLTHATNNLASIAGSIPTQSTVGSTSQYSQFVTGDSKTGRVNPELVTVDWENEQFHVKPANESGNTVSNATPLTSKERASAFKVSFSEATIRYQKTNEGETTDNIALKVYPVTPGITDKIDINGSAVSLMDILVGMYSSVVNLESLMSTNVEISKVIASNGASAASGSAPVVESDSKLSFPDNLNSILRGE